MTSRKHLFTGLKINVVVPTIFASIGLKIELTLISILLASLNRIQSLKCPLVTELLLQPGGPGPARLLQVLPQGLRRGARPLHEAHRVPEHARGKGRLQGKPFFKQEPVSTTQVSSGRLESSRALKEMKSTFAPAGN